MKSATSKKRAVATSEGPPDRAMQLLGDFALGQQMGTYNLDPQQFEWARRSAAYRALIRSSVETPENDALHSLTRMWERVGSPAGKSPHDWRRDQDTGKAGPDEVLDDRGEAGFFADWQSAGWYTHFLDPENFGISEVLEQCY
jgi:hypothetical protein